MNFILLEHQLLAVISVGILIQLLHPMHYCSFVEYLFANYDRFPLPKLF